jgi:hypothetical protein
MVLDGPMSGEAFLAYVEQALVPELRPGDVVIMDNLPAHKAPGCGKPSRQPGQASNTSRPTAPTSIPSKWPSQNSNLSSEVAARIFQTSGRPSPTPCAASHFRMRKLSRCRRIRCNVKGNALDRREMEHVCGTHGKIERWHQTLKNRTLLVHYCLPRDLARQVAPSVASANRAWYHERLDNPTPTEVYFGRTEAVLLEREGSSSRARQSRTVGCSINCAPSKSLPSESRKHVSNNLTTDSPTFSGSSDPKRSASIRRRTSQFNDRTSDPDVSNTFWLDITYRWADVRNLAELKEGRMPGFEEALKRLVEDPHYREAVIQDFTVLKRDHSLSASELVTLMQVWVASGHRTAASIWNLCHCCCSQ